MNRGLVQAVVLIAAIQVHSASGSSVTVDDTRQYQTIDGFGAFGAMTNWWFGGPYYNDAFLRLVIDTIGVTIIRTEFYPQPDEPDQYTRQVPYLRAIKAQADRSGEPLKVVASIWTPPAGMKDNNSRVGGALSKDRYDDFADYMVSYVQRFRTDMGYDLYALSPQNEPAITPGYNSCAYWPADLGALINVTGPKFRAAGLKTWLHYADNIWWPDWLGQTLSAVSANRVADSVADILSIHYSPNEAQLRSEASQLYAMAQGTGGYRTANFQHKNRLWNSEFGGQFNSWREDLTDENGDPQGGAFTFARNLFLCLFYGFNAVVYWSLCEPTNHNPAANHYALMNDGRMGPLAYVAKSFYRHIRPGAVRVGCTSDDSGVWCIAFKHAEQQTATIVMLNTTGTQRSVVVKGANLPSSMVVYQTSSTQNCVRMGTATVGGSVTLTPNSVTTLSNDPVTTVRGGARQSVMASGSRRSTAQNAWGLNGQRVAGPVHTLGVTPHAGVSIQVDGAVSSAVRTPMVPGR